MGLLIKLAHLLHSYYGSEKATYGWIVLTKRELRIGLEYIEFKTPCLRTRHKNLWTEWLKRKRNYVNQIGKM